MIHSSYMSTYDNSRRASVLLPTSIISADVSHGENKAPRGATGATRTCRRRRSRSCEFQVPTRTTRSIDKYTMLRHCRRFTVLVIWLCTEYMCTALYRSRTACERQTYLRSHGWKLKLLLFLIKRYTRLLVLYAPINTCLITRLHN